MTRTTKISKVRVSVADYENERFLSFVVTVSDLGKTDSVNKRKVAEAVKAVDGWKESYEVGRWTVIETVEELRYMPDDIWFKYSVKVEKDTETE